MAIIVTIATIFYWLLSQTPNGNPTLISLTTFFYWLLSQTLCENATLISFNGLTVLTPQCFTLLSSTDVSALSMAF